MRLSKTAAFYLQGSLMVSFLAGSAAPTPLYALYQAAWGFSPITVTVVFGIYALAVLGALLVVGSLSDYIGRRPVLIGAALAQAVTMFVFIGANGVPALIAARILQGLATGFAAGAIGAGMLDIDREKGTIANAISPMLGTGSGALLSGLLVQFLPAPTVLVYAVLAAVFVLQALGVALMPETAPKKPGALASLRPRFHLPPATRRPMLLAVPALVAAWAFIGFYGSLGPVLVRHLVGGGSRVLGGVALTVIAGGGVAAVLALRARPARSLLGYGTSALVAGVALTLMAVQGSSVAGFFIGSAVAGMGFGATFQGAIRSVVTAAAVHERAGVLSLLYVVSYLAMGVPAVIGGIRFVHGGDVIETATEYGLAVIVLAGLAMLGNMLRARAPHAQLT
jgi:MFS family permease